MADVSASLKDWSEIAANNGPAGTASIGAGLDDNLRQIQATVKKSLGHIVSAADYGSALASTPGADINLAVDAVNSAGGGVVVVPPRPYTVETSILQKSNVTLDIRGATLTAATGLNSPVITNATAFTSKVITVSRSGRTATATSNGHGYSNGTWVFINGADQTGYNGVFQIFNITANTFDYYVEKTTTSPATGTLRVYQATDTNLGIKGGKIVGNAANTTGDNYGVLYNGVENFSIEGLYVQGTYHHGLGMQAVANGTIVQCRSDEVIDLSSNGFLFGSATQGAGGGASYCANIVVDECRADRCGQTGLEFVFGRNFALTDFIGLRNVAGAITSSGASQLSISNCLGRWNGLGLELFLNNGASDIHIDGCIFNENEGSGITISNNDTARTASRIVVSNNVCSYNDQNGGANAYGINVIPIAASTIDSMVVSNNICNNNARGISFDGAGTVSNVTLTGNKASGNTSDAFFGSLQTSTLVYGLNTFANTGGNGIVLPAVTTASFAQILGKSSGSIAAPADTNLNVLATIPVSAGVLGTNGQIIIECEFTFTNNGNNKTLNVSFDGTSLSNVLNTTQESSAVRIRITNNNSATAQRVFIERIDGSTLAAAPTTLTKDTTLTKNITIAVTKAVGGDAITLESYRVTALVNS